MAQLCGAGPPGPRGSWKKRERRLEVERKVQCWTRVLMVLLRRVSHSLLRVGPRGSCAGSFEETRLNRTIGSLETSHVKLARLDRATEQDKDHRSSCQARYSAAEHFA